jgi:hypothetical protein
MTTIDKAAATANVLDEMTSGIMGRKADKATKLTPVGTERRLPMLPHATFPNDHPQEIIEAAIREMRRQSGYLSEGADALEEYALGKDPKGAPEPTAAEVTKAKEREADEKFADRLDRLSEEAKAAVFGDDAPDVSGWSCPTHPGDSPVRRTSHKGRSYLACDQVGCREFQK